MIILFNQNGSDFEIIYENETWTQGDFNAHSIKAVILNEEVDVASFSGFISFLRDGEIKSSPRLAMFYNDNIVYNGTIYKGFEFKTNSEWYTEIAGNLKCTIEIAKYTDSNLTERKAYGVVNINVIGSAYTEQSSTITNEEYLALISKVNLIDYRSNIIGQGNYEFKGDKTFNGSTRFEQEVILNYSPSSMFSAVSIAYVSNGYYDKSYIDDVVNEIKSSIDTINATQNVIDIVPNYANLQNYGQYKPNIKVLQGDKIEVLEDETQGGANTIYTAFLNGLGEVSWSLVGSKSPYYSKTESDERYLSKDETYTKEYIDANFINDGQFANGLSDTQLNANTYAEELVEEVNKDIENIEKRVSVLEYFNKGITYNDVVDSDEALVKAVPKGASPYALLNKVGGRTLKVVQLAPELNTTNWVGIDSFGNGVATYTPTRQYDYVYAKLDKDFVVGHTYLVTCDLKTDSVDIGVVLGIGSSGYNVIQVGNKANVNWQKISIIKKYPLLENIDRNDLIYVTYLKSDNFTPIQFKNIQVFDLTAMFGVGNEPTSVEEFNMYFPKEYYPYNEGEFIESKPTNVKIIGKNLFDISKTQLVQKSNIAITNVTNNSITITTNANYQYKGGCPTDLTIKDFMPSVQAGKTYIATGKNQSTTNKQTAFVLVSNISDVASIYIYFNNPFTLTEQELSFNLYYYGFSAVNGESAGDCVISNIQIEEGTTATDYEEYKESNIPINVPFDDLGLSVNNYGNYIDFENKKYVKNCKRLTITSNMINYCNGTYCTIVVDDKAKGTNVISKNFKIITEWSEFESSTENCIFVSPSDNNKYRLEYKIVNFTTRQEYVDAFNSGFEEIIYEIINPTEQDISNYLPNDNVIEVEGNGNIVFENTENTAIPSEVEYQVKVGV